MIFSYIRKVKLIWAYACLVLMTGVNAERVCYSAEETCSAAVTCQVLDASADLCVAGTIPGIDTYNKLIKTPTDYQLEIYGDPFCTLALITSNATLNTCGEVTIPLLGFGFYFKVTETVSSTTSSIAATATSQIASTVPISETKPAATAEDQPTDIPKGTLPPTPDQPNDAENNNSANPFVCLLAGMFVFEVLRFTSA